MKNKIEYSFFGSSHGECIGMKLRGINKGEKIDAGQLQTLLGRRKPTYCGSTGRREADEIVFERGVENGFATGVEIVAKIYNKDVKKGDYEKFKRYPRPSHADYVAIKKYGKEYDVAGGGQFSGRMTAPMCIAGGIALQILGRQGVQVCAYVHSVGGIKAKGYFNGISEEEIKSVQARTFPVIGEEEKLNIIKAIETAQGNGDSLGGVVECCVFGLPVGVGEPMLGGLESEISKNLFSIPGVKGVEFGRGFEIASLLGSEANDSFYFDGSAVKTRTNNSGGINGGISNGMPVVLRVAFRPTPSISKEQKTVDLENCCDATLAISGRHDACFVPRAVPVVESLVALSLLPSLYENEENSISSLRNKIDSIDEELIKLLNDRMDTSALIGKIKNEQGTAVFDPQREKEILKRVEELSSKKNLQAIINVYGKIFEESKAKQTSMRSALIGKPLGHSFSKLIHNMLGAEYDLLETEKTDLQSVLHLGGYNGFNVTLPYKKEVVKHLDSLDEIAEKIGSVNTVKVRKGALIGYNTDAYGLEYLLSSEGISLKEKRVTILGSGGASLTVLEVARRQGAKSVTVVSRSGEVNYSNCYVKTDVLINTTPVGMYPDDTAPVDVEKFTGLKTVVDLIYNPINTRLVFEAKEKKIKGVGGLKMLVAQAVKSFEIFNDTELGSEVIENIYNSLLYQKRNVALIGMPSSGKSSIGKLLAEKLGKKFIDTDIEIEKFTQKTIPQIFEELGESGFRKIEKEVIKEVFKGENLVVATGGGAVLDKDNRYEISKNSLVVHIKRNAKNLVCDGRPLIKDSNDILELERQRMSIYCDLADLSVENDGELQNTVNEIAEAVK